MTGFLANVSVLVTGGWSVVKMVNGVLFEGSRNGSRCRGVTEPRASDHSGGLVSLCLLHFIEVPNIVGLARGIELYIRMTQTIMFSSSIVRPQAEFL